MSGGGAGLAVRHGWTAAIVLGAIGWLVNLMPLSMTPGIDLLFGGIPAVLAAATLGARRGLLAGAIAGSQTVWLWGHPYAWLIFSLEAGVIGLLVRGGRRPLVASTIYWLALGLPLLLVTYWGILGVRGSTASVLFLKQPFNGLVNAMVVEALLLLPLVRGLLGVRGRVPLRAAIAATLAITAVFPAMLFGVWTGRSEWDRNLAGTEERLILSARAHAAQLEQYVRLHEQEIRSMAQSVERRGVFDVAALQRHTDASREQFTGFLRVYVGDSRGVSRASAPATGDEGAPLVGVDYSARPYFQELRRSRATVISEVLIGTVGAGTPVVVIADPVVLGDTLAGFVLGSLDLTALPVPEPAPTAPERLRVADRAGRIIFDSRAGYAPGERPRSIADSTVFAALREVEGPRSILYTPDTVRTPAAQEAARVLAGVAMIPSLGWWVWTEQPISTVQAFVAASYLRLLAILIAVTVASLALSNLFAAFLARPLLQIRAAATAVAAGERSTRAGELPAAAPAELAQVAADFDRMADSLASHATELEELSEIARTLAGTLEPDRVLAQVADAAARLVDADGCTLALTREPEADGEHDAEASARVVAASGRSPHALGAILPLRSVPDVTSKPEGGRVAACPLQVSGETIGFLVAYRDRTPFSTVELRLLDAFAGHAALALRNARLLDEAQSAARARSQFIATVSHELRTPLNAVLGHLQILEMGIHGPVTPEQRETLGRIGTASRHLLGLIEEVLSFGRLEAGRNELNHADVDVAGLAREIAAVIAPLAAEKSIGFRMEAPEHGPVVRTDADRVRQILINLAGNAVKFTDRGEVCIRVHEDGDGVVLAVHDTGPGIPSEDQLRLFRPFEQLHAGFARPHGGTGLGLYLSSEYARLLGGTIRVRSVPGEGSTFSLVLPRDAGEEPPQ